MNKQQARKYHQQKVTTLMGKTRVHNETQFHILDEATMHIIDHFNPPEDKRFSRDHVMIIGAAHLGESRENESMGMTGAAFFTCGDLHELSHTLAEAMRADKAFATCIFHAVEVYALHDPPTNKVEL